MIHAHTERARNGVRWWQVAGVGIWVRDLRAHPRRDYDPRSLRISRRYRVALFIPRLHKRRNERRTVRSRR